MALIQTTSLSLPAHSQLWESVVYSLRMAIVTGELPAGTHLVETQLAEKLGVSRGPVRDALTRLEHEGLVVNYPYRGKFVANISNGDIHEIYAIRLLLESYAVELAIQQLQSSQLHRLQELRMQMIQVVSDGRFEACADLDVEFHRVLVSVSKWERLLQMWETLAGVTHAFIAINVRNDPDIVRDVAEGHERILEALARHDVAAAKEALRVHLVEAEVALLRTKAKVGQRVTRDEG